MKSGMLMAVSAVFLFATKTDFSGTWKLNHDETIFSQEFSEHSVPVQLNIRQEKKAITIERISINGKGETHQYTETLPFDGKTVMSTIGAAKKTASLAWSTDDKSFTVIASYADSTMPDKYKNLKGTTTWNLSDDGKKLTINSVEELSTGNDTTRMVFDKQ